MTFVKLDKIIVEGKCLILPMVEYFEKEFCS